MGDNDASTPDVRPRLGAGFDGLETDGRNENRGAESTLAALSTYQQARRLRGRSTGALATIRAHPAHLEHDPSRVVARFFLPGDGLPSSHSRVTQIVARVLDSSDRTSRSRPPAASWPSSPTDTRMPPSCSSRTPGRSAAGCRASARLTEPQALVLGAAFTAEYAVEGAALCNPSAVVHPSQEGLAPGQLRVAVALRCIGEGHISSIGFAEAVIGADDTWTFAPRAAPITGPRLAEATGRATTSAARSSTKVISATSPMPS